MKILMTNHQLADPGGSELFVAEVAAELLRRGHTVAVFSTLLGAVAESLGAAGIPVVRDPVACPFVPELIHGQHHLETMAALCAWPGVPALYFLHGAAPWEESPPVHPRILKYVGTSFRFAEWTARLTGIPAEEVGVVRNFFDPARIPRCPDAPRSRRAVVFHNTVDPVGPAVQALRAGCQARGLAFEGVGVSFGRLLENPAALLADSEVVFAAGRSAIEAMASGCTVIPLSRETLGETVTPENLDLLASINFCAEATDPVISAALVEARLARISPAATSEVTARIRATATLSAAVDALHHFHGEVLAAAVSPNPERESLALGNYLVGLASAVKGADDQRAAMNRRLESVSARATRWKGRAASLEGKLRSIEERLGRRWWTRRLWRSLRRHWNES